MARVTHHPLTCNTGLSKHLHCTTTSPPNSHLGIHTVLARLHHDICKQTRVVQCFDISCCDQGVRRFSGASVAPPAVSVVGLPWVRFLWSVPPRVHVGGVEATAAILPTPTRWVVEAPQIGRNLHHDAVHIVCSLVVDHIATVHIHDADTATWCVHSSTMGTVKRCRVDGGGAVATVHSPRRRTDSGSQLCFLAMSSTTARCSSWYANIKRKMLPRSMEIKISCARHPTTRRRQQSVKSDTQATLAATGYTQSNMGATQSRSLLCLPREELGFPRESALQCVSSSLWPRELASA